MKKHARDEASRAESRLPLPPDDISAVSARVREQVKAAGFDRVGFAKAGVAPGSERLRTWLARGYAGEMDYLARTLERRIDPGVIVPDIRSVIVVALHYPAGLDAPPQVSSPPEAGSEPEPEPEPEPELEPEPDTERGRLAAYALGTDYHRLIEKRLKAVCQDLRRDFRATFRYYVDTGPVLERDWAQQAGIGWIGKNTCAIDAVSGSYFFLATILTTVELTPDPPAANHCGSCRLCLDACPTDAFAGPYELDARRCISYLTIEHRGELPAELENDLGEWIFGCDICQEVCPYNRDARHEPESFDPELTPRAENQWPDLARLAELDEDEFRDRFSRSAVRRARWEGFLRNVLVALGNTRTHVAHGILRRLRNREPFRSSAVLRATLERAARKTPSR